MQFTFSWGILFAAFCYFVVALCAVSLSIDKYGMRYAHFISLFLAGVVIVNLGYFALASISTDDSPTIIRTSDEDFVKDTFGFVSGVSYPLTLGSQTSFLRFSTDEPAFSFSNSTISGTGGAAITISFEHNGSTWDIAVPRSTNTIRQSVDEQSSVSILLNQSRPVFNTQQTATVTVSDCMKRIHNLVFTCDRTVSKGDLGELTYRGQEVQKGLANYIEPRIISSEMVMSPDMYNQLIGRIN